MGSFARKNATTPKMSPFSRKKLQNQIKIRSSISPSALFCKIRLFRVPRLFRVTTHRGWTLSLESQTSSRVTTDEKPTTCDRTRHVKI